MQAGVEGLIPDDVDIGEDMSLWKSMRRGSTTEVLKKGLDTSVIETNNRWRKREGEREGG